MAFNGVKWLWGYRRIRVCAGDSEYVLECMRKRELSWSALDREADGSLSFVITEKEYKILAPILDKTGIKVYSVYGRGLPFVCRSHRNRVGLLVGLGLYFILIFLSTLFIWDVKVVSDTHTPHNVIISNLNTLGCYEGAFLPAIDFEDLCIDYLEEYKDFSWVSVNVRGSVAYVEIQEKDMQKREESSPRNLVASHGGVIESYSVYEGRSQVQAGNVVKKGDLLVSGILENKEGAVRLCRARGRVVAAVDTVFTVEQPYTVKKQVYTGRSFSEQSIRFFNMTIPFFGDPSPEGISCTSVTETDSAVLFEKIELPLSIEKEVFREYRVEELTYTEEEAEQAAKTLMRERFEAELTDAELISVETVGEHTDKGYTLTCKIKCRMDITTPADIEIG